jgi:hypothetical protein
LTPIKGLRFHLLLFCGFQRSGALSLCPHPLDCEHHIRLLRQKGVPEIRRPLNVTREHFHDIREWGQTLNARVPWLFGHGVSERLILQTRILSHPLLELHEFDWVSGSNQGLA